MAVNIRIPCSCDCLAKLTLVILSVSSSIPAQQSGPVRASFELIGSAFTVHEPIFVRFTVENRTPTPLLVGGVDSAGYGPFRARMIRPDGRVDDAPTPRLGGGVSLRQVGSSCTLGILLPINAWFDTDIVGHYVLELETTQASVGEGLLPNPFRARFPVDVTARDEYRLTAAYADIERKFQRPLATLDDAQEAHAYMTALEHARDPIAVSFLVRLLDAREVTEGPLVIQALRGIGDGSATDAIISRLHSRDPDTLLAARTAIKEIERTTTDPLVKAKIAGIR